MKPPPILHGHLMSKLRLAVINLMLLLLECLWHEAVAAINTLWLAVFLPVNVSFWFLAWEETTVLVYMTHRNPADAVSHPLLFLFALLLSVSYCFVRNTSGADECEIKQSGRSAGFVQVDS